MTRFGLVLGTQAVGPMGQGSLAVGQADEALVLAVVLRESPPHPEAAVGGEAIAAGRVKFLGATHEVDRGLLEGIGGGFIAGGQAGAVAAPGVTDQLEVVAHQLVAGPQPTAPHGLRGAGGARGMGLPALDTARQFEHGAIGKGLVAATGLQPIRDRRSLGSDCHRNTIRGLARPDRSDTRYQEFPHTLSHRLIAGGLLADQHQTGPGGVPLKERQNP